MTLTHSKAWRQGRSDVLAGLHVLVLEDEEDARDLLTVALEGRGAKVRAAATADEASELLRDERPDVIVSDIGLPVKDGCEFLREVRAMPVECGGDVPAVALTAYGEMSARVRALASGFQAYLVKPCPVDHLATVVRGVVTTAQRERFNQ